MEWYFSDVSMSIRLTMWMFYVWTIFKLRIEVYQPLMWTLCWYWVNHLIDNYQTIQGDNGSDSSWEIILFISGTIGLHALYFFKKYKSNGK
jgi:hypothetical protein